MKTLILMIMFCAVSAQAEWVLARTTVYWAKGARTDKDTANHKTSSGVKLEEGHVAVDPKIIPYGSTVYIKYDNITVPLIKTATDTGSHVIQRRAAKASGQTVEEKNAIVIDIFFNNYDDAKLFADTHPMFARVKVEQPKLIAMK